MEYLDLLGENAQNWDTTDTYEAPSNFNNFLIVLEDFLAINFEFPTFFTLLYLIFEFVTYT